MNLAEAADLMLKLGIGPKEAAVLAVIDELQGRAQMRDIVARLKKRSMATSAIVAILRRKRLVVKVENPFGFPHYKLTRLAELKLRP